MSLSSFKSTLFRGSLAAFTVNTLGYGLVFTLQVLLARTLSTSDYGAVTLVLSWVALLNLVSTMGFDMSILKLIPKYQSEENLELTHGLISYANRTVALFGTTIYLLAAISAWSFSSGDLVYAFWVGLLAVPIIGLSNLRQSSLRAFRKIVWARAPEMILRPLLAILFVSLALKGLISINATIYLLAFVVFSFLAYLLGSLFLRKALKPLEASKHLYQKEEWKRLSLRLCLLSGIYVALSEIDRVMLGALSNLEEVAVYGVAARVSLLILFGLQAVNTIAVPLISEKYHSSSKDEFRDFVRRVTTLITLISLPALLVVLIFGNEILHLFGEQYTRGYSILFILSIGQAINFAVGPVGFMLTMTGHENDSLRITLAALVINSILNIPAIIFFGALGVAFTTALSIAIRNIATWHYARVRTGVDASILAVVRK